jgi:hypothetical protein
LIEKQRKQKLVANDRAICYALTMSCDQPLGIAFLSQFVEKARWMKKHRSPWRRLLYRLAVAHLELLTEREISGMTNEHKWRDKVK